MLVTDILIGGFLGLMAVYLNKALTRYCFEIGVIHFITTALMYIPIVTLITSWLGSSDRRFDRFLLVIAMRIAVVASVLYVA